MIASVMALALIAAAIVCRPAIDSFGAERVPSEVPLVRELPFVQ